MEQNDIRDSRREFKVTVRNLIPPSRDGPLVLERTAANRDLFPASKGHGPLSIERTAIFSFTYF